MYCVSWIRKKQFMRNASALCAHISMELGFVCSLVYVPWSSVPVGPRADIQWGSALACSAFGFCCLIGYRTQLH